MPASPCQNPGVVHVELERVSDNSRQADADAVAVEQPLEIRLGFGPIDARSSTVLSLTMRTPGNDADLAVGYLYGEGIISGFHEVLQCTLSPASTFIRVELAPSVCFDPAANARHGFMSSACGVCGRRHLSPVERAPAGKSSRRIHISDVCGLSLTLHNSQDAFQRTGGIHAAALFNFDGTLALVREDVGRHNAVDKAIGAALARGTELDSKILLVSGRAGYELVQKAVTAGIPVLAAIGAPSSLAIELADRFDLTLIGFLRKDRFNLYTSPWRLA